MRLPVSRRTLTPCVRPAARATGDTERDYARATLRAMAQAPALPSGFELPLEPRLPAHRLRRRGRASRQRAADARHALDQAESKLFALELAIRMMDLTTLEGADTPGKVAALCSKAMRPDPSDPTDPAGRGGLRLPEPRAARASSGCAGSGRQGRLRRDRVPVRPVAARRQARGGRARSSSSAPTRSTW